MANVHQTTSQAMAKLGQLARECLYWTPLAFVATMSMPPCLSQQPTFQQQADGVVTVWTHTSTFKLQLAKLWRQPDQFMKACELWLWPFCYEVSNEVIDEVINQTVMTSSLALLCLVLYAL